MKPIERAEHRRKQQQQMTRPDLSIIIVDDLQFSRIVVKTALKKAGYNGVRMADSATEALRMLREEPADVVLADWMMPEMDGLELTDRIRQRDEEKGTYTAIILFTANEGTEYLVKAFDHGVDDYLRKPPNPDELAARVNAAARIAAMQNDLLETSRQMESTIRRLEEVALIDPVSGAGNQRLLTQELRAHLLEASSRKGGVCLAMLEINELNALSSEHGNTITQEILISLHRRLRRTVRPTDTIARLESNVFAIVMHHTNPADYKEASLERIIISISQRPFKTSIGHIELSAIMGVQYYIGEDAVVSAREMMVLAEQKLLRARSINGGSISF
jgi:two-component system cell cycle response regulator